MTSSTQTKLRYQEHHATGNRYGFSFGEVARSKHFLRWLDGADAILDAGCRDGTLLRHIARKHRVVGCDIDHAALRLGRCNHGLSVVNCDLTCGLPFASGSFDAVILGEVLEHLPVPSAALEEIYRVLRGGGRFIGSVPNAFRLKNRLNFLAGRAFDHDPTHLQFFSPGKLRALLEHSRFENVAFDYLESRFLRLSPALFGNTMLWRATKAGIR